MIMIKTGLARGLAFLALAVMAAILAGCVTEISGGLPPPASTENRVRAQLDLARAYLEQRENSRAKPALSKALDIDPRNVEAHVLSAVLFHTEKEYELAEFHYKTALRIDPDNAQALNNYGTFLYSRERYADAIVPLDKLVRDTSYRARSQAFENLGLVQLRLGEKTLAEASFDRALELNFRQARATLELADIAYDRGDIGLATSRLLEFRTMAQQNARSLCLTLKVATATDDNDLASSTALALNNLFPDQAAQCQVSN
jgi:type IV pilus assembly protein PilF